MDRWTPTIPSPDSSVWLLPLLMLVISASGYLAGWLRTRRSWPSGDTRKLFHFVIISTATVLSLTIGVSALNLLGLLMALYIATVVRAGPGSILYAGIARASDAPHASLYILLPFLATAAGGVLTISLFGPWSSVGFVASGWGDAVGEPIGTRFGRRRFRVPALFGASSVRSLEGSAAVFAAAFAGAFAVIALSGLAEGAGPCRMAAGSLAAAGAAAVTEAVSPRGLDNLTVPLVAAGVARAVLATR
jgi:phytol kinase